MVSTWIKTDGWCLLRYTHISPEMWIFFFLSYFEPHNKKSWKKIDKSFFATLTHQPIKSLMSKFIGGNRRGGLKIQNSFRFCLKGLMYYLVNVKVEKGCLLCIRENDIYFMGLYSLSCAKCEAGICMGKSFFLCFFSWHREFFSFFSFLFNRKNGGVETVCYIVPYSFIRLFCVRRTVISLRIWII